MNTWWLLDEVFLRWDSLLSSKAKGNWTWKLGEISWNQVKSIRSKTSRWRSLGMLILPLLNMSILRLLRWFKNLFLSYAWLGPLTLAENVRRRKRPFSAELFEYKSLSVIFPPLYLRKNWFSLKFCYASVLHVIGRKLVLHVIFYIVMLLEIGALFPINIDFFGSCTLWV